MEETAPWQHGAVFLYKKTVDLLRSAANNGRDVAGYRQFFSYRNKNDGTVRTWDATLKQIPWWYVKMLLFPGDHFGQSLVQAVCTGLIYGRVVTHCRGQILS